MNLELFSKGVGSGTYIHNGTVEPVLDGVPINMWFPTTRLALKARTIKKIKHNDEASNQPIIADQIRKNWAGLIRSSNLVPKNFFNMGFKQSKLVLIQCPHHNGGTQFRPATSHC